MQIKTSKKNSRSSLIQNPYCLCRLNTHCLQSTLSQRSCVVFETKSTESRNKKTIEMCVPMVKFSNEFIPYIHWEQWCVHRYSMWMSIFIGIHLSLIEIYTCSLFSTTQSPSNEMISLIPFPANKFNTKLSKSVFPHYQSNKKDHLYTITFKSSV